MSQKWLTRNLHWSLFIRLLIRLMKFVTTEKYLIQVLLYCNRFLSELSCLKHERSRGEGIYGRVVMVNLIQWFGQLTYTMNKNIFTNPLYLFSDSVNFNGSAKIVMFFYFSHWCASSERENVLYIFLIIDIEIYV